MAKRPPVWLGDLAPGRGHDEALRLRRLERRVGRRDVRREPEAPATDDAPIEPAPTTTADPATSADTITLDPAALDDLTLEADEPVGPAAGPVVGTTVTADAFSPDARLWENRSGDPDAPYQEMRGPDVVYDDGVWYAERPDGTYVAFHEGRYLAFDELTVDVEYLTFESTAGTGLWDLGPLGGLGLDLDGETGDFRTEAGIVVDPDALTVVRAADGTLLVHDAASGSFSSVAAIGVPLDPAAVSAGPYSTVAVGPGASPPLDELGPGASLVFDPDELTFTDADGDIVGFQETLFDDARVWENRSDEPDSPYQDMQGADVTYVDGRWYVERPDGTYQLFHEGRYLDLREVTVDVEFLDFETTVGTPLFGEVGPGDVGLRLDGETGGFVDAAGDPVDLDDFDPTAPDFGFGGGEEEPTGRTGSSEEEAPPPPEEEPLADHADPLDSDTSDRLDDSSEDHAGLGSGDGDDEADDDALPFGAGAAPAGGRPELHLPVTRPIPAPHDLDRLPGVPAGPPGGVPPRPGDAASRLAATGREPFDAPLDEQGGVDEPDVEDEPRLDDLDGGVDEPEEPALQPTLPEPALDDGFDAESDVDEAADDGFDDPT